MNHLPNSGEFDPRLMTGLFVVASLVVMCCFLMVFFDRNNHD